MSWECPRFSGWLIPATLKPLVCQEERRLEVKLVPFYTEAQELVNDAKGPVRVFVFDGEKLKEKKITEKRYVELEP